MARQRKEIADLKAEIAQLSISNAQALETILTLQAELRQKDLDMAALMQQNRHLMETCKPVQYSLPATRYSLDCLCYSHDCI